jgi:hypothetical protein
MLLRARTETQAPNDMLIRTIKAMSSSFAFWALLILPILVRLPQLLGWSNVDPLVFVGAIGDTAKLPAGTPWIDPNVGFQAQALGKLAAEQWLSGQVPWWNSFNGVGLPLAAEMQPGAFFLPFVLLYHFRLGFVWVAMLMQIIAGMCTYAVLRKIELTRFAALIGALLFELNGTFAWHGEPIIAPVAFLPMLLLGVELVFERVRQKQAGGWALVAISLAWSIAAGFPETAYINGLFVALWVLFRLPDLPGQQRLSFLYKLAFAVCVGVACSLPLIIPFAEYLSRAFVGSHDGNFAHVALPAASAAVSLMPALYGPPFAFNDPASAISITWESIGGYFTLLQFTLALLAIQLAPRRITAALLLWLTICLCKTYDIRPISDFINLLPMVKSADLHRYSPPSWEFAATVLVAMGIDSLRRGNLPSVRRTLATFSIALCVAVLAIWLAREPISALLNARPSAHYIRVALTWFVLSLTCGLACILWLKSRRYALHALALLLVLDAAAAYAIPMRSRALDVQRHEQGIAFLQSHTGVQRVYGLGQMAPNYGAFFQVAQINHNYLPLSNDWLQYIHQHLDPAADPITFNGYAPRDSGFGSAMDQLRQRLPAYEELGVKYVLAPAGVNPFAEKLAMQGDGSKVHRALALDNNQVATVHWRIPAESRPREVNKVSVLVGTYGGHSDGQLNAEICLDEKTCVSGKRSATESQDNALFALPLDHTLTIPSSNQASFIPVTVRFTYTGATQPLAIWLSGLNQDQVGLISLEGSTDSAIPTMALDLKDDQKSFHTHLAYDGQDISVYELTDAKPYFEITQGHCALQPTTRNSVQADCASPATLLRREAFYPGWTASVDGQTQAVTPAHVGAGQHNIAFNYRPTHYWIIVTGFSLGLLAIVISLLQEIASMRRRVVTL